MGSYTFFDLFFVIRLRGVDLEAERSPENF